MRRCYTDVAWSIWLAVFPVNVTLVQGCHKSGAWSRLWFNFNRLDITNMDKSRDMTITIGEKRSPIHSLDTGHDKQAALWNAPRTFPPLRIEYITISVSQYRQCFIGDIAQDLMAIDSSHTIWIRLWKITGTNCYLCSTSDCVLLTGTFPAE